MSVEAQAAIAAKCDEIKAMLLKKNEAYGDSVFETRRTFSDITDPLALIRVRMDDKLARIRNAQETGFKDDEDPYLDLIGYLILYLVVGDAQRSGSDAETVDAALGYVAGQDPCKTALQVIADGRLGAREPGAFAATVMNSERDKAAKRNEPFSPTVYSTALDLISEISSAAAFRDDDGQTYQGPTAFARGVLARAEAESA